MSRPSPYLPPDESADPAPRPQGADPSSPRDDLVNCPAPDRSSGAPERWPVLARLGAVPPALWKARLWAAPRRALVVTASLQLTGLAIFTFVSALRPYDGLWLRLAAGTWLLWLWPLAGLVALAIRLRASSPRLRVSREISLAAVAEELDHLNPGAPDVFRTALRPQAHAPATREALERLYAGWESRLRVPDAPRLFGRDRPGAARSFMAGVAFLSAVLVVTAPVWLPASLVTSPRYALNGGPGAMLVRMFLPLRALAAIPAPRLTPDALPVVMAHGDTLVVAVAVEHVPPHQSVYAHVRAPGGADVRYELMPVAEDHRGFRHGDHRAAGPAGDRDSMVGGPRDHRGFRFGPVTQSFTIRFATGRAMTRPHAIDVLTPPGITSLSAVVTPPSYTGLPPETFDPYPEDLAVLPGSRIAWSGTVDRPLARWHAHWKEGVYAVDDRGSGEKGGEAAEARAIAFAGGEGERLAFTRTVRAAGTLGLSLTDHAARGAGRSLAGPWRIDVRPDHPPEIVMLTPAGDGELPRSLKVPLVFRARDDFGISAVRLHYSLRDAHGMVKSSAQRDVTAWRDVRDGHGSGVWDGSVADAFPVAPVAGESVEFYLEALDNNTVQGPAYTRSAIVRLRLPSLEEARETLSERERAATTGLTSALEREKRREREAARPDRAAAAEAMMPATEWDVRRVLSDAPRRHAQELRRQIAAELELARGAPHTEPRETRDERPSAAERRDLQQSGAPKNDPAASSRQVARLEALRKKVEELERRMPGPDAAHAPTEEQRNMLESLRADQRELERALAATPAPRTQPPPSPSASSPSSPETSRREGLQAAQAERRERAEQAARDRRGRLEDELKANQREQEQLQGWLDERQRMEAAEQSRREAATRQAEQAREDLESALQQMEQAIRTGLEDGTLAPDILEKMDRVRELLQEVLDEREVEEWERAAQGATPTSDEFRRALDEMKRPGGMREDLEQAIRMLEAVRELRELQALAGDLRSLEEEQRALAREMDAEPRGHDGHDGQQEDHGPQTAEHAARQESLAKRLEQNLRNMERLADKPSMKSLPRETVRKPSQDALQHMQKTRDQLGKKNPDREGGRESANLAAQKLDAAAAGLEKALAQMERGKGGDDKAVMREVVEETLEFTRWLDGMQGVPGIMSGPLSGSAQSVQSAWNVETSREDAQAVARVARWLAGRMDKLAATRAFESDVLRRSAAALAVHADALATQGSRAELTEVGRHARDGARELLKWLSQENEGGGSDEGDGQGDNDFGGGEQGQGEEGSQGMASRMRGASGQQMAANRMTQELLRSLMEQRQEGSGGEGAPDPSGGGPRGGRETSGHGQPETAGGDRDGRAAGGTGRGEGQAGAEGGRSGSGSGNGGQEGVAGAGSGSHGDAGGKPRTDGRGAAANAQQQVADELESLAERADDAGGAARTLRRLADEARELERALREGRLDPEEIRKRQERFRTRLLQSADAMEERGHREERRGEVWAGGPAVTGGGNALPADSLAAELKRRRENARRLPLTPEQKRRVEWYYERLLGE